MTGTGCRYIYYYGTFTFILWLGVSALRFSSLRRKGLWINAYFIAYSVVYRINILFANTYSACCPLSAEHCFAMQSDHLFLNRTQLLYFSLCILLSVSVTWLIYNQTKKIKVTVQITDFFRKRVVCMNCVYPIKRNTYQTIWLECN